MLVLGSLQFVGFSPSSTPPKQRLAKIFSPTTTDDVLRCPVDGSALVSERTVVGSQVVRRLRTSAREYPVNEVYVDLLSTSGRTSPLTVDDLVGELRDAWESRTQTQMFRTPWLAFVYERGWRQQFRAAGFPGIDAEFAEVNEFFAPAAGGVVVDMSCGSGLMTRRLARSKAYGRLLAVDYSESMLAETRRRCEQEKTPTDALTLCRADVAQLPLADASIDAMHAGAALHSWPRLETGLAEIRRVLKPGGRFFATTFVQGAYGVRAPGMMTGGGGSFRFFDSTDELKQLMVDAGFDADGVDVRIEGRGCAIVKCVVPAEADISEVDAEAEAEVVAEARLL